MILYITIKCIYYKFVANNVATFQSPQFGPIGMVTKQEVYFYHKWISYEKFQIEKVTKQVPLLKAYAGMDESFLNAILSMDLDGLVIEAFGQGNLPPVLINNINDLINKNIPVVIVSRSFKGVVQPTYGYKGGGKQLHDMGVIFAKRLSGPKARIKLLMILDAINKQNLRNSFEH